MIFLEPCNLNDDNLFLRCFRQGDLRVRRITNPGEDVATWEEHYTVFMSSGLIVHGELIMGPKLRELAVELMHYRMSVNRQGYCYVVVGYSNRGTELLRVNDLFDWSRYGAIPKITTLWNRCKMNNNTTVVDYENKEKEFADMKLQLKEKNRCIVKRDKELREKNDRIEKKDQELSEKDKRMALLDQELKDCKSQLQMRERELSLLTSLWGRRLGTPDGSDSCRDKGLHLCKTCLEQNEHELTKMNKRLCVEQKRGNDLNFAMDSEASCANYVGSSIRRRR